MKKDFLHSRPAVRGRTVGMGRRMGYGLYADADHLGKLDGF